MRFVISGLKQHQQIRVSDSKIDNRGGFQLRCCHPGQFENMGAGPAFFDSDDRALADVRPMPLPEGDIAGRITTDLSNDYFAAGNSTDYRCPR